MYKQTFPIKVSRIRMASLLGRKSKSGNTFQELLEKDEIHFLWKRDPRENLANRISARALEQKMNFKYIRVPKSTSLT